MVANPRRLTRAQILFLLLLGCHAVYQMAFLVQIVFMPGAVLKVAGISVDLLPALSGMLAIAGAGQGLLVVLSVVAIVWGLRAEAAGYVIGIVIGAYFLLLGIALAAGSSGYSSLAVVDIARGGLTLLLGLLAWRAAGAVRRGSAPA